MCAADEIWRLQRGSEADCVFFQRTVNGGRRITDGGTRQGMWVIAPGGVVLARINTRNVDKLVTVLEDSLAAWETLPDDQRHLPADVDITPAHRWEQSWPEGGLALERIVRDLADDGLQGIRSNRWNRDHVWVARHELASWIPSELELGDTFELPLLAHRLARFHLVDNAAGQTIPYADEEIERASLSATVTAVQGTTVSLQLRGITRADSDGRWLLPPGIFTPSREIPHGIETELLGTARWNTASLSFDDLQLVATGRRWGHTQNNSRRRDPEPARIGFLLRLESSGHKIAPTFVSVYDVDWIEPPAVAAWLRSPAESVTKSD